VSIMNEVPGLTAILKPVLFNGKTSLDPFIQKKYICTTFYV
jgi:hypothetical protein